MLLSNAMAKKTGRPPIDDPRRNIVGVRLTDDEHELARKRAREQGVTVPELLRRGIDRRAKR